MTLPDQCPDCDTPLHGDACRHCGWVRPDPDPPEDWLEHCRRILKHSKNPSEVK